jgi:hypothetical protein
MAASSPSASLILAAMLVAISIGHPAAARVVDSVQYYHKGFEHYFMTVSRAEIDALDENRIVGWWRTGARFHVDDEPGPGLQPVCRFYSEAFGNKASHFFTADASECERVKANPDWRFEGIAFHARVPRGPCEYGTTSVERFYNNGMSGAPNHAYVVDGTHRQLLRQAGWSSEGVVFCVDVSRDWPAGRTAMLANSTWMFPTYVLDGGYFPVRFAHQLIYDGTEYPWFAGFGMATPPATIYVTSPYGVWRGYAGFVPASGKTILAGRSGFEPDHIEGEVWEFDDTATTQTEVCNMVVHRNLALIQGGDYPFLHEYQPLLWTGCRKGIAMHTGGIP